jgi:serine/threonine-protein kinase
MATLVCGTCHRRYTSNKPPTPGKIHRCTVCQGILALEPDGGPVPPAPVAAPPDAAAAAAPSGPAPVPGPAPAPGPSAAPGPAPVGPQAVPVETRFFGKYRIDRVLGRGGMGVVYEAFDPEHGRRVALKTLLAKPSEVRKDVERFSREIRLSAGLPPHPNIVSVYDAGVIEEKRYLAMEFIEGTSFDRWREAHPVSLRTQVAILRDVALAVSHAHVRAIIHRDLKPQNILIDAAGSPHVTDFGLAKTIGAEATIALTMAGMAVGSPTYMSAEQARGLKTVDHRTDIYAVGVMLYEALAGRPPFQGKSPFDLLSKVVREPLVPPSRIARERGLPPADPALEAVCLKALARNPDERHASAADLADDLSRWLEGKLEVKGVPAPAEAGRPEAASAGGEAAAPAAWWRRLLARLGRLWRR